jgi:hypothetical protein
MTSLAAKWALFAVVTMSLVFMATATLGDQVSAVKKSSSIKIIHKTPITTVATTTSHNQIKGIKILHVHTMPSNVAVGDTFSVQAIVFNNSTATITFANGTCNSPVSLDFNKNVMMENQGAASCTTATPVVTLKPQEHSAILSPNHSGIAYKATAPGTTNATISFIYGVEIPTGKSPISDNVSRVYTFNIQPTQQGNSSQPTSIPATTSNAIFSPPGAGTFGSGSGRLLTIKYPDSNVDVPAGSLIAVGGTSAPSNATHTNCNVAVQINQHGFVQASPRGPKGAGDYTKWTAITAPPTRLGLNQIEAQLLCFPSGTVSTPNLIKHLVHNVTGLQVVGMSTASQPPSSSPSSPTSPTSPLKHTAPTPPPTKKAAIGQRLQPMIPLIPGQ